MRYAVSVGYLGYTRCNNVCVYNPESRGFDDLTPAEARRFIDRKQLKGVLWRNGEDGPEFYPDSVGFNQTDIMIKSANKFRPMLKDVLAGNPVNSFFTVVRILDTDYRGRLYEVVSNKYSRVKVTEQNLRELNDITVVAGVWITEDEIKICDGVIYENRKADAVVKKGVYKDGIVIETLPSIKEVLGAEETEKETEVTEPEAPVSETEAEQVEESEPEQKEETLDDIFGKVNEEIAEQVEESEPEQTKGTLNDIFGKANEEIEEQVEEKQDNVKVEEKQEEKVAKKTSKRTSKKK